MSDENRYSAAPSDRMREEEQLDEDAWSHHTSSVSTPTDRLRFLEFSCFSLPFCYQRFERFLDGSEA